MLRMAGQCDVRAHIPPRSAFVGERSPFKRVPRRLVGTAVVSMDGQLDGQKQGQNAYQSTVIRCALMMLGLSCPCDLIPQDEGKSFVGKDA
jgi:hypothetical protein